MGEQLHLEHFLFDFCKRRLPLPILYPAIQWVAWPEAQATGATWDSGLPAGEGAAEKRLSLQVEQWGARKGSLGGSVLPAL